MLNNGCVPSQSGPTEVTADFRFTRVMAEQAARARLTLDDDQLSLIARLDALGQQLVSTTGSPQGVYVWGRTGRGKSFILDHFFASLPLAARRRVHFHHFFRELHQRLNAPGAPDLQTVMRQMTSGCRLLCFDEFHLHDPGDAMLIKALLEHLFQHGIVLLYHLKLPTGDAAAQSAISRSLFTVDRADPRPSNGGGAERRGGLSRTASEPG